MYSITNEKSYFTPVAGGLIFIDRETNSTIGMG